MFNNISVLLTWGEMDVLVLLRLPYNPLKRSSLSVKWFLSNQTWNVWALERLLYGITVAKVRVSWSKEDSWNMQTTCSWISARMWMWGVKLRTAKESVGSLMRRVAVIRMTPEASWLSCPNWPSVRRWIYPRWIWKSVNSRRNANGCLEWVEEYWEVVKDAIKVNFVIFYRFINRGCLRPTETVPRPKRSPQKNRIGSLGLCAEWSTTIRTVPSSGIG